MAIIALHSASTGLRALSTGLDVIANNLANANTDAFKASRVNFQDLLYIERAQPGVENISGDQRPIGVYVGLGVKVSGTQFDFRQGTAQNTGRELDVMIEGNGFFQVQVEDELGVDGLAYTRAGAFSLNAEGEIVLATDQGRRLVPNIQIPPDATQIAILQDGTVLVAIAGEADPVELGTIDLATFINPAGLKPIGENLFVRTAASGEPSVGQPLEGGRGGLRQGFLEGSNVDPVVELVNLIRTQRAFEMNSQSIQAADEALQTIGRLRRF